MKSPEERHLPSEPLLDGVGIPRISPTFEVFAMVPVQEQARWHRVPDVSAVELREEIRMNAFLVLNRKLFCRSTFRCGSL